MYKNLILISFIALFTACSASRSAKRNAAEMEVAPTWVKSRPVSSVYYIGIGKVSKISNPEAYQETAKRIALNDLASEISVNIQSNSLMSSFEDNAGYKSEFTRYIQMEMSKDLEGYQMQGSFETEEQYMVYYRLSKAKWAEIQAKRKAAVVDRAKNLFFQAQEEKKNLNYFSAISTYLNSLLELKKYWNEAVYYSVDNQKRRLDMDIRSNLISTLSEIQLVVEPSTLDISFENHFKNTIGIKVVNADGQLLKNFPITVNYRKTSIPFQTIVFSSSNVRKVLIENIKYKPNAMFVLAEIQKNKVLPIKSDDKHLLKFLQDAFQVNPIKIEVNYELPRIYIEDKMNKSPYYHYLKNAIQQSFGKQHYSLVYSKNDADLIFELKVHESEINANSEVKMQRLSYSIKVIGRKEGTTIYTYSSDNYKGVAYSIEEAKEKAYINASEEVNESSFKKLLQAIVN